MNFQRLALSLFILPRLGGVLAGVLEAGTSSGESENSIYRASGDRFRYPARDYSEQSEGTPGVTLKVSVASDTGSLDLHSISHTNAEWLGSTQHLRISSKSVHAPAIRCCPAHQNQT